MNEIELVQLPNGIENFLSELKPARKAKWNCELRKFEEDNSPETIERQKAGCELVKSSLRDIYSFGETIARGTPKFCLALNQIFDNLKFVEGEANIFPYGSELDIKASMGEYCRSDENFTKLVGQLGLSSTSAYRYKDLGKFVDKQTGDWLTEFKGYSISLLSEIWTYASKNYLTHDIKELAKIIPADTTIETMRQFSKVRKLWYHCKAPFDRDEERSKIRWNTPLPKVLKIYNKLIQQAEAEQQKQEQAKELHSETEYPGQLPGQTAITLEEVQQKSEEVIPDVGKGIESENNVSEEAETALPTEAELIKYGLKNITSEIKLKIYDLYFKEPSIEKFAKSLPRIYNYTVIHKGSYCLSSGGTNLFFYYSNDKFSKIQMTARMSYLEAAQKIMELISFNEYLTDEERKLYQQRELEYDDFEAETSSEEVSDEESEEAESFPDVGKVIDIEPEEVSRTTRTNREYLAALPDEQFALALCLKIIGIYPMNGKSAQFMSTVKSKLIEWLGELREVTDNE